MELSINRECGKCTMCCLLTEVPELKKQVNIPCEFCSSNGCDKYSTRPESCKNFKCRWLKENWNINLRPDKCNIMFEKLPGCSTYVALVKPQYKQALNLPQVNELIQQYIKNKIAVVAIYEKEIQIFPPKGVSAKQVLYELNIAYRRLL